MAIINSISARWILDSRGFPTVKCEVTLDQQGKKAVGSASVPSGASTGTHEALELRDGEKEFGGKGVSKAVFNVNEIISKAVLNREFLGAAELDEAILALDSTENKSELGANAILGVSMAAHRAFASLAGLTLWQYLRRLYFSSLPQPTANKFPRLMCNILNGGVHADSGLAVQEFMIIPNTQNVEDDIRLASEVYQTLKSELKAGNQSTGLGDEGGFAPRLEGSEKALEFIDSSITKAGYSKLECDLGLDAAASEFFDKEKNVYNIDGQELSQSGLTDFWTKLQEEYNLISIEDGFAEDDILGWEIMTQKLGSKMSLIGDDLFVTNMNRFRDIGLKNSVANGVLIKLNQIGSVLETCQMINLAKENNYKVAVSHRSGETTDDFIADLAFASQADFLKAGAPARGERVAKYNRLLDIRDGLM